MISINLPAFLNSLSYMLMGMLGIFIVTGIIIAVVYLLNKVGAKK